MDSIFDRIGSYEFDKNKARIFGIKSAIVWGQEYNTSFPLLYISKPKNITQEEFEQLLDRLEVRFK